jgi:hypothetical protein
MGWHILDNGTTVGSRGSESGVILLDDEHSLGARITLERDGASAPFSITCGIYGWMVHTRFFGDLQDAELAFDAMKHDLSELLEKNPLQQDPETGPETDPETRFSEAIGVFVNRFP